MDKSCRHCGYDHSGSKLDFSKPLSWNVKIMSDEIDQAILEEIYKDLKDKERD